MNNQIEKLTFKNIIMSIGAIPSSYVDSMSYYETLVWLCNYLQETVIPTVNNNGQAVEELQSAYITLHNYVEHYFDNLDVQEEINNKLDQMAEDGSLTLLIKNYVDPIYQAYEQSIHDYLVAESQSNLNFRITVNDQIESLTDRVNIGTSGSPKGVYATVSALETADPDHDYIYLVTADGKWYYYDTNDGWTAGGTYQSTGIADNVINVNNLTLNTKDIIYSRYPSYTLVDNKYRNGNNISNNNAYTYTSAIQLLKGETIRYNASGESNAVSLLCLVDEDNEYIKTLKQSTDTSMVDCKFTAPYNLYVSITYKKSNGLTDLVIYKSTETQINDLKYQDIYNNVTREYITKNGSIYSHNNYLLTDYVEIAPNTKYIIKNLNFTTGDAVGYCLYDKNYTRITGENYVNNSVDYTINKTPLNTKYIRFCFSFTNSGNWAKIYLKSLETIYESVNELKNDIVNSQIDTIKRTCGIAKNVICCGDSLTVGISDTASETYYTNSYNYPYFLQKLMNIDNISKIAHGGYTSTQWWEAYENSITATNSLYIVWLCTNDTFTDTVATDCNGNDYTQFADTETGNLGKIIGKILSLSGNRVILLNQFTNTATKTTNNKVISDLADKYNLLLVDLSDVDLTNTIYHTSYTGYIANTHLNNKGYNYVANIINNNLNEYLSTEQFEFHE